MDLFFESRVPDGRVSARSLGVLRAEWMPDGLRLPAATIPLVYTFGSPPGPLSFHSPGWWTGTGGQVTHLVPGHFQSPVWLPHAGTSPPEPSLLDESTYLWYSTGSLDVSVTDSMHVFPFRPLYLTHSTQPGWALFFTTALCSGQAVIAVSISSWFGHGAAASGGFPAR